MSTHNIAVILHVKSKGKKSYRRTGDSSHFRLQVPLSASSCSNYFPLLLAKNTRRLFNLVRKSIKVVVLFCIKRRKTGGPRKPRHGKPKSTCTYFRYTFVLLFKFESSLLSSWVMQSQQKATLAEQNSTKPTS